MNKNTNKGITLIALVITIIVMLILVAVTIQIAVNGGLFKYAGKAAGDTKNAIEEENGLTSGKQIKVGDTTYNSMDSFLNGPKLKYYIQGNNITVYLEDSAFDWLKSGKSENEINNKYPKHFIEKKLGVTWLTEEEFDKMGEEEQEKLQKELLKKISVTLTTPDGNNEKLVYFDGLVEGKPYYVYQVNESGNYIFKATDSDNRTSEITIPIKINEFSLKFSETETETFKFTEGQTWNDFIGTTGKYKIDDAIFEKTGENISVDKMVVGYLSKKIKIASLNTKYLLAGRVKIPLIFSEENETNRENAIKLTDKIESNKTYYVNSI